MLPFTSRISDAEKLFNAPRKSNKSELSLSPGLVSLTTLIRSLKFKRAVRVLHILMLSIKDMHQLHGAVEISRRYNDDTGPSNYPLSVSEVDLLEDGIHFWWRLPMLVLVKEDGGTAHLEPQLLRPLVIVH